VTDEVADSAASLCWEQAGNRLTAMRGLLVYFTRCRKEPSGLQIAAAKEELDKVLCDKLGLRRGILRRFESGKELRKTMEKNQFRLADVILSVICVVFVAEAAAPVASIGNSQYFWWIFMILAFLLPYGLIAAELGTAYAGDGGLYDWIHAAYPDGKWAARASWYYWINFPLWMRKLKMMTEIYERLFKSNDGRNVRADMSLTKP